MTKLPAIAIATLLRLSKFMIPAIRHYRNECQKLGAVYMQPSDDLSGFSILRDGREVIELRNVMGLLARYEVVKGKMRLMGEIVGVKVEVGQS